MVTTERGVCDGCGQERKLVAQTNVGPIQRYCRDCFRAIRDTTNQIDWSDK